MNAGEIKTRADLRRAVRRLVGPAACVVTARAGYSRPHVIVEMEGRAVVGAGDTWRDCYPDIESALQRAKGGT